MHMLSLNKLCPREPRERRGEDGEDGDNKQEAVHKSSKIRCANSFGNDNCVWEFIVRVHMAQLAL